MKSRLLSSVALALLLAAFTSGCATKTTGSGGRETNVLAGVVAVSTGSFEPTNPATVDVDTTKIAGKGNPSGTKVSLLWGLITLKDY